MFRSLNRWVPAALKGHKTPTKPSRNPKGPIADIDKRYYRFYLDKIRTLYPSLRIGALNSLSCQEIINQWLYSQSHRQEIQRGKRNATSTFFAGRTFYRIFKSKRRRSTSDFLSAIIPAILLLLQSKYLHDISKYAKYISNDDNDRASNGKKGMMVFSYFFTSDSVKMFKMMMKISFCLWESKEIAILNIWFIYYTNTWFELTIYLVVNSEDL